MTHKRRVTSYAFWLLLATALMLTGMVVQFGAARAQEAKLNMAPPQPAMLGPAVPPELTQYASDWPVAYGNLAATRAAAKSSIDAATASKLGVAWTFKVTAAGSYGGMTATPLIAGDTVYVQDMMSNVFALDRATGTVKWEKKYNTPTVGPNGLAIGYGMVYGTTGDSAEVFALNAKDGTEIWRVKLSANPGEGIDMAPAVYDNVVYVSTVPGNSQHFYRGGAKGILYALEAKTGAVLWQFDTTTDNLWGNARLNDGGGLWYPPSFDHKGNLYFGTGNAGPWPGTKEYPNGSSRPGANDYASSMVSLDPAEGSLRWFHNARPHDLFDHDFQLTPILTTITLNGKKTPVAIGAGKTGTVIAVNANDGEVIWQAAVGKHENDTIESIPEGKTITVYPGVFGGVETPMAYASDLIFVPVVNFPTNFTATGIDAKSISDLSTAKGELVALDVTNGKERWKVDLPQMPLAGATVANDIVFTGTLDGVLHAFDIKTGKEIWTYQASAGLNAPPAVAGDMLIIPAAGPFVGGPKDVQAATELIAFKLGATSASPAGTQPAATASAQAGPSPTPASAQQGEQAATIEMIDISFKPNEVTIPANTSATITLVNHASIMHNFSITNHNNPHVKDLNISVNVNPGETKTVTINAPAGTYYFYCNVPGHEQAGMFGYVTAQAGAAIATAEATITPPAGS